MYRLLVLLAALALPATVLAADRFDYEVTFDDGTPGVMHASVEKPGDKKHAVTCSYAVSQERVMDLPDMPLGSWRVADVEKVDRAAVRELCLGHYQDALPRD
jgi:hypothetical protein